MEQDYFDIQNVGIGLWLYGCTENAPKEVVIPSGVTRICSLAAKSSGITSVVIPNSVREISRGAFANTDKLTSVFVDQGNDVFDSREDCNAVIQTDTNRLVAGCRSTIIPESVESIGVGAFDHCQWLSSIVIPEGVKSIEEGAFANCVSLSSVVIPDSVTTIGENAFRWCKSLKSIHIPKNVNQIVPGAFSFCKNLSTISVDPDNNTFDSRNDCNAIINSETNELVLGCRNTVIPKDVTSISDFAFEGCKRLTAIDIPDGITNIGKNAFGSCVSLTSVLIPESVTSLDIASTFRYCDELKEVIVCRNGKDNLRLIIIKE